jgi:general stress protein 26
MATMKLSDLAEKMKDIDFSILSTHTEGGQIAGRPMSNNREVEYDGKSYYFAWEQSRVAQDIQADPKVSLALQANKSLLGKPGIMITVEGSAELIRDKNEFKAHWSADLARWFEQGIDTPGMVLIRVNASRIHYWDGEDQGELQVP